MKRKNGRRNRNGGTSDRSQSSGFEPFPIRKLDYSDPYREHENDEENYLLTRLNQEEDDNDSLYTKSRPVDLNRYARAKEYAGGQEATEGRITMPSSENTVQSAGK